EGGEGEEKEDGQGLSHAWLAVGVTFGREGGILSTLPRRTRPGNCGNRITASGRAPPALHGTRARRDPGPAPRALHGPPDRPRVPEPAPRASSVAPPRWPPAGPGRQPSGRRATRVRGVRPRATAGLPAPAAGPHRPPHPASADPRS